MDDRDARELNSFSPVLHFNAAAQSSSQPTAAWAWVLVSLPGTPGEQGGGILTGCGDVHAAMCEALAQGLSAAAKLKNRSLTLHGPACPLVEYVMLLQWLSVCVRRVRGCWYSAACVFVAVCLCVAVCGCVPTPVSRRMCPLDSHLTKGMPLENHQRSTAERCIVQLSSMSPRPWLDAAAPNPATRLAESILAVSRVAGEAQHATAVQNVLASAAPVVGGASTAAAPTASRVKRGDQTVTLQKKREMLSPEQRDVVHAIEQGRNVFFTGCAGTGKSFLLGVAIAVLRNMYKRPGSVAVCASTGIAASHIEGTTLHSFAGCGVPKTLGAGRVYGVLLAV